MDRIQSEQTNLNDHMQLPKWMEYRSHTTSTTLLVNETEEELVVREEVVHGDGNREYITRYMIPRKGEKMIQVPITKHMDAVSGAMRLRIFVKSDEEEDECEGHGTTPKDRVGKQKGGFWRFIFGCFASHAADVSAEEEADDHHPAKEEAHQQNKYMDTGLWFDTIDLSRFAKISVVKHPGGDAAGYGLRKRRHSSLSF